MADKKRRSDPSSYSNALYDTVDEAVLAAASIFNPVSTFDNREFGGGIVKDKNTGKYYFTWSAGGTGEGAVRMAIRKKAGDELAALWHTHAQHDMRFGDIREKFSRDDVENAARLGVPSFIATPRRVIRMLNPLEKGFSRKVEGPKGTTMKDEAGSSISVRRAEDPLPNIFNKARALLPTTRKEK